MAIPAAVRDYLRRKGGRFRAHAVPAADNFAQAIAKSRLPSDHVVEATVVTTGHAPLMVIHSVRHEPDMRALESLFHRPFGPCRRQDLERIFLDCDLHALPPLPEAYGMKAVVDASLAGAEEIWFAPGRAGFVVRASGEEFARLTEGAWHRPVARPRQNAAQAEVSSDMREQLRLSRQLPIMPDIARQLLALRENPYSHVSELVAIAEQDPVLVDLIVSYAAAPLHGRTWEANCATGAIAEVLGMDFAIDLVFALSLARGINRRGPAQAGVESFWRQSLHTAALAQALCERIPFLQRPSPGMAFVAGLVHNVGWLLLGDLFPEQYSRLTRTVQHKRGSMAAQERQLIGFTHGELGLWLMEDWGMPREIVDAVSEHHNLAFRGDFAFYANLVGIANVLLTRHGISDAEQTQLPAGLLESLGLKEMEAEVALRDVIACREHLMRMARKMVAG